MQQEFFSGLRNTAIFVILLEEEARNFRIHLPKGGRVYFLFLREVCEI